MDHVALGMPALVLLIAVNLDKLLENGTSAAHTFNGKSSRVMKVTVSSQRTAS